MAKVLENVGERTIEHLDYVGSLNIQLWATLRAMGRALPFVGNRYRLQATVKQMLEIEDLSVEAIANEVGYEDASFFGRLFRRKVGLTPTQYRRRFSSLRKVLQG